MCHSLQFTAIEFHNLIFFENYVSFLLSLRSIAVKQLKFSCGRRLFCVSQLLNIEKKSAKNIEIKIE